MFISKKELEELIENHKYDVFYANGDVRLGGFTAKELSSRTMELAKAITQLEEYLGIHYEKNTFEGYVKNKKK